MKVSPAPFILACVCVLAVYLVTPPVGHCKAAVGKHDRATKLANPAFIRASETYKEGRFSDALKQFDYLDKNGLCCDMTHYYIALCYQRMNQVGPALDHYQSVVAYSADPRLRQYAQTAFDQLSHYKAHRTYEGQGNNFSRFGGGSRYGGGRPSGGGGGGGGC